MAIVPPFQQKPIDPKSGFFTLPWVQWLLRCSDATNGAAPADAQYVLGAADAALTNGRVLTDTDSVTWDLTTAAQAKANAVLHRGTVVTLTNAQIQALPTTGVTVIAAPGATKRIAWFLLELQSDFAAGGYTNVDTTLSWIAARTTVVDVSNFLGNDAGILLTALTTFLGAVNRRVLLQPYTYAEPVNTWGNLPAIYGSGGNEAIVLHADNNGAGNFTGGHAANSLRVSPIWITTDVS